MRNKKQTRKYYLHRVIKKFAQIQVHEKRIVVAENQIQKIDLLQPRQKRYLNEIREIYQYTIQSTIPLQ